MSMSSPSRINDITKITAPQSLLSGPALHATQPGGKDMHLLPMVDVLKLRFCDDLQERHCVEKGTDITRCVVTV